MSNLPSPYNAATGGVKSTPPPPLLPLWRIMYRVGPHHGTLYLRAVDITAVHAELQRLNDGAVAYAAWQMAENALHVSYNSSDVQPNLGTYERKCMSCGRSAGIDAPEPGWACVHCGSRHHERA